MHRYRPALRALLFALMRTASLATLALGLAACKDGQPRSQTPPRPPAPATESAALGRAPAGAVVYACADGFRFSVRVRRDSAVVLLPAETLTLPHVASGSGAKYAAGDAVFWSQGVEASLKTTTADYTGCKGQPAATPDDEARLLGFEFRGVGQEPGWTVEIDEGRSLRFTGDYGKIRIVAPAPAPARDTASRTVTYTVKAGGHDLTVAIRELSCRDAMSGAPFSHTVRVKLDGRAMAGCGRILAEGGTALFSLSLGASVAGDPGRDLNTIADEYVRARLEAFPEFATQLGIPGARHDRLRDHSAAAERAWWKQEDALLARLRRIAPAALGTQGDRVTHGVLLQELESSIRLRTCRNRLWTVSPLTGWQALYAGLAQQQPIGTPELRKQALARWQGLPRVADAEIANLREGVRSGYTAPAVNVRRVIEGLDQLIASPATKSPFYQPATRDSTPAFRAAFAQLAGGPIAAALRRYRDFLANEYLPQARDAVAITANPGGEECYRAAIRRFTTLDLDAEELHKTGLRELAAAESTAAEISRRSFGNSEYRTVLSRMNDDPKFTIASREGVIPLTDSIIARAWAAAPKWFGILPKAPVKVEPFPAFEERSVPAGQYLRPALDGSRPGIYRINLYLFTKPGGRLEADRIAFHEAIPGHHFQLAIAQERTGVHPVTRYLSNSAFSEGWGIYSERVAEEMGLYSSDADRLKDLEAIIYTFATVVMETGVHAKGWTRQQAIAFETTHTSRSEEQAALDVDRRIGWPGQGLSYPVGYIEIRRLRSLAQQRQGERFDIRAFHDRVLEDGSVPLGLLRDKIERWIEQSS